MLFLVRHFSSYQVLITSKFELFIAKTTIDFVSKNDRERRAKADAKMSESMKSLKENETIDLETRRYDPRQRTRTCHTRTLDAPSEFQSNSHTSNTSKKARKSRIMDWN